jgi:hypothetical protein
LRQANKTKRKGPAQRDEKDEKLLFALLQNLSSD